jgi:tetratricopeptide (TPR) repeat protein
LPELRERYPDLPEPTQEEATARQHLFEAVTRLGKALAERQPLVLLIEDWHWADSASLDMLHYASQRWTEEKAPILVLLTLRQEALTELPAVQSWLDQLKRTVSAVQIKLGELSQAETEQLVQGLLTPAAITPSGSATADTATQSALTQFSHWLFQETEGQPLFLTEALKVLVEEGVVRPQPNPDPSAGSGQDSASSGQAVWQLNGSRFDAQRSESGILAGVREIVQGWLTRISAAASDLLMAAAVLAQAASFDNLCRVTGLDERQAVTALEELLKRQLLIEPPALQRWAPDPVYTFSHQKVSEVVYAETGTARRRMLHRRAFGILQAMAVSSGELARHALAAGLPAETIRYSLMAGNDALALFAVRVALTHYETAWRITEQQGWPESISGADKQLLYSSLGRAYELSEDWIKAEEIYEAMISYAESIRAPAMECLGLNQLSAIYYLRFNRGEQAVALLERAKKLAEQNGDERWLAETELNLAMAAYQNHDHALTLHHAEQALDIARKLDHPHLIARHLSILAYVYLQQCKWEKLETFATEASRLYTESGNLVLAAESDGNVGFAQICSGKPQEALATLEKTVAFSSHIENLWGETDHTWKLALAHLELGHYGFAIKLSNKGIKMARQLGLPPVLALSRIAGSQVQRKTMSLAAAQESLLENIAASREHRLFAVVWEWTLTELCAAYASAGNWEQAADYARQRLQACEDESLLPVGLTGWYETEALLRSGDGDLARAEVERLARIVGNNRRYRLILLRSQAVLAQWDDDVDQAIAHLQAALALAQEIGLPGEAWPILAELARLYAEQGEDGKAKQAYGEAAIIIQQLAETVDEDGLRVGYLTAIPVCSVLERNKATE